jgi:hypothetical protein
MRTVDGARCEDMEKHEIGKTVTVMVHRGISTNNFVISATNA